jgi:hypothetical protein
MKQEPTFVNFFRLHDQTIRIGWRYMRPGIVRRNIFSISR